MKILQINQYFDGGTFVIDTDIGTARHSFAIDNRLFSTTKNQIYDDYPRDDNSNLIIDSKSIQFELLSSLKSCEDQKNQLIHSAIDILEKNLKQEIRKLKINKLNDY